MQIDKSCAGLKMFRKTFNPWSNARQELWSSPRESNLRSSKVPPTNGARHVPRGPAITLRFKNVPADS
jgi:hypothetical protein